MLLHRSVIGRALYAIGFSVAGRALRGDSGGAARRPGLRVVGADRQRRGDHLRRAPGAGPIGRRHAATSSTRSPPWCSAARRCSAAAGRSGGTLLGLFALAVLQTGLHLAAWPSELTGVSDRRAAARHDCRRSLHPSARGRASARPEEELEVKNSQVAVLCGAILAGVADRRRHQRLAASDRWATATRAAGGQSAAGRPRAALSSRVMPKAKGDPVLRQLPRRRRGGGAGARCRSDVGRTDRASMPRNRTSSSRTGSRARSTPLRSPSRTGPAFRPCCARRASAASAC